MKKLGLGIVITVAVLMLSAVAVKAIVFVHAVVEPSGVIVEVPDVAVKHSPALKDIEPGTLEKTLFVHYADGRVISKARTPVCYKLYGVKWNSLPVSYVIHPDVESTVPGAVFASAETWDSATSKELFKNTYTLDSSADWDGDPGDYPDGRNEYSFGNYPEDGVIAVTVLWTGVPTRGRGRQIIEYDVLFDTDFAWQDCSGGADCTAAMDLQNIATHETGHGVGLADIYNSVCSTVTMYGYSWYGDVGKRTLEGPDIMGLQKLYGI